MKLITLSILFLLAAVAASAAITKDQLIGHWRWTDNVTSFNTEYASRADGTFRGVDNKGCAILAKFTGTWSAEEDILRYVYTGDTSGRAPIGARDHDKLLEVAKDYYVIQNRLGAKHRYVRVK